jgi:hypothetical protein
MAFPRYIIWPCLAIAQGWPHSGNALVYSFIFSGDKLSKGNTIFGKQNISVANSLLWKNNLPKRQQNCLFLNFGESFATFMATG